MRPPSHHAPGVDPHPPALLGPCAFIVGKSGQTWTWCCGTEWCLLAGCQWGDCPSGNNRIILFVLPCLHFSRFHFDNHQQEIKSLFYTQPRQETLSLWFSLLEFLQGQFRKMKQIIPFRNTLSDLKHKGNTIENTAPDLARHLIKATVNLGVCHCEGIAVCHPSLSPIHSFKKKKTKKYITPFAQKSVWNFDFGYNGFLPINKT